MPLIAALVCAGDQLVSGLASLAVAIAPSDGQIAEVAMHRPTFGASLATAGVASVAQLAGTQAVAVPQPGPVAVPTPVPPRFEGERVGEVADTVGVVVDFGAADVATSDPDSKRDVGMRTRHRCLRGLRVPGRYPSVKDGPGVID